MNLRTQFAAGVLLCATTLPGLGGSGGFTRDIRYPTRYEVRSGPNGVAIMPTQFSTRQTGSRLKVEHVGIANNVVANGKAAVRLRLADGRTLVTQTGRMIKLDGTVFRTAGWRDGNYLLVSQSGNRRTLAFAKPE